MKRACFLILCTLGLAAHAFSQTSLAGLSPKNARSMGMGGSFRVFSSGYETFFGNPAGFSGPGTLTLADAATWAYLKPLPSDIGALIAIAQGTIPQSEAESGLGRMIAGNGFGAGASVGLGWAGKGLGIGLTVISDSLATGSSYSDSVLSSRNQANAIFGVAWPLELGPVKFAFGVDIRGFYRLDSLGAWPFGELASTLLSGQGFYECIAAQSVLGGYGLAVDTGATLGIGPLSAGIMIRDYGYKFYMENSTIGDIGNSGSLPILGTDAYALIPVYTAGLGLKLNNGKTLASSFYVEVDNPMNFLEKASADFESSLVLLHAGAELKVLNFLSLRGGFNQGLLSFGTGIDLALVEIDAAIFSERISENADSLGRSGLAVQVAVRF
jgi:hypothetical protein